MIGIINLYRHFLYVDLFLGKIYSQVEKSLFLVSLSLRHTHIFLDILGPDCLVRGIGRVEGAAK